MNYPEVIFIINSIQQQRCIKRIEEFIENGYRVKAYGFSRSDVVPTLPQGFEIEIIGSFSNSLSYFKRLKLMYKALKPIFDKYKNENIVYYYFLLDVALVCRLLSNQIYIYEESDLMHTYLPTKLLRSLFNFIDRRIIKKSLFTVMTSEGFVQYHFGETLPANVHIIPNRLNLKIESVQKKGKKNTNINSLRFAFVGGARFDSVFNFIKVLTQNFPEHEFHFYGGVASEFEKFRDFPNVYYHGKFSNPIDLPEIYSNIDIVIATYDIKFDNVRFAEPNKLYEAIYFETPIIVSKDTYLAQKVKKLGVGFQVNALNDNEIVNLIQNLTNEQIEEKQKACMEIPKKMTLNKNDDFFEKLKCKLKN